MTTRGHDSIPASKVWSLQSTQGDSIRCGSSTAASQIGSSGPSTDLERHACRHLGTAPDLTVMGSARLAGFKIEGSRERYAAAYNRTLDAAGVDVLHHDVPTRFGATHVLEVGDTAG